MQERVDLQRRLQGEDRSVRPALAQADLGKPGDGTEMAWLEFQRASDVGEAVGIALRQEAQGRPLVPRFRPLREVGDEPAQVPLGIVDAPPRDAGDRLVHAHDHGGIVVIGPDLPDAILDLVHLVRRRIGGEGGEQEVQFRQPAADGPPLAPRGDQFQDFVDRRHRRAGQVLRTRA